MKIEIFYIDGCPNRKPAVDRVMEALKQVGVAGEVVEVRVVDAESATSMWFLGSPTIHVNGVDVERSARMSKQFGLMCRTYSEGLRRVGVPPLGVICHALREASGQHPADMIEA